MYENDVDSVTEFESTILDLVEDTPDSSDEEEAEEEC
jgi:hypothetical protein